MQVKSLVEFASDSFNMSQRQKDCLAALSERKKLVVMKHRQCGATTLCTVYTAHSAFSKCNQNIIVIVPKLQQSINFIDNTLKVIENTDANAVKNRTKSTIELTNGSFIRAIVMASTLTECRGLKIDLLVIDEATFMIDEDIVSCLRNAESAVVVMTEEKLQLLSFCSQLHDAAVRNLSDYSAYNMCDATISQ